MEIGSRISQITQRPWDGNMSSPLGYVNHREGQLRMEAMTITARVRAKAAIIRSEATRR